MTEADARNYPTRPSVAPITAWFATPLAFEERRNQEEEMSRINGEKARAALAKRRRTAQRVKARATKAAALSASANSAPTAAPEQEK